VGRIGLLFLFVRSRDDVMCSKGSSSSLWFTSCSPLRMTYGPYVFGFRQFHSVSQAVHHDKTHVVFVVGEEKKEHNDH
jgi:hypothetical protein